MNNFKVLIVDDEESVRLYLQKIIEWEKHGFHIVAEAENGYEALKHINSHDFDLIVTDIRMPILDGIEFINKIREISDSEIVVLSGYAEFEYAKKVMEHGIKHYLLKPIDEVELIKVLENIRYKIIKQRHLKEISKQQNSIIKERAMTQVLFGSNEDYCYKELCDILQINPQKTTYCAGVVKLLTNIENLMPVNDQIIDPLTEFTKIYLDKSINIHFCQKHECWYFLYCFNDKSRLNIKKIFEELYSIFISYSNVDSCFGVGHDVSDIYEVKKSMREALAAADYSFFEGINKIIYAQEIMDKINLCQPMLTWDDTDFLSSIKLTDRTSMDEQIDLLFDNLQVNFSSSRMVQTILINLVFKINEILAYFNTNINELNGKKIEIQDQLFSKRTIFDLKKWFREFCYNVIEHIRKIREIKNPDIVLRVKRLVEQNFAEDIYLKDIAQDMFYSADYIGKLFKESVGVSFNEYVNIKRIEYARELLLATDNKISHISNLVGFRNIDYFTKQFKKLEGKTPKEFRNQYILGGR